MRPGWKNRIDERRYFEEKRAARKQRAMDQIAAQAFIDAHTARVAQYADTRLPSWGHPDGLRPD